MAQGSGARSVHADLIGHLTPVSDDENSLEPVSAGGNVTTPSGRSAETYVARPQLISSDLGRTLHDHEHRVADPEVVGKTVEPASAAIMTTTGPATESPITPSAATAPVDHGSPAA